MSAMDEIHKRQILIRCRDIIEGMILDETKAAIWLTRVLEAVDWGNTYLKASGLNFVCTIQRGPGPFPRAATLQDYLAENVSQGGREYGMSIMIKPGNQAKTLHIIGIHGPKRVGKDTFATHLVRAMLEKQGYTSEGIISSYPTTVTDQFHIDRIADPLYHWAEQITGWNRERLMGSEKDLAFTDPGSLDSDLTNPAPTPELIGKTPRSIMLDLGMWVREHYSWHFLSRLLQARAERAALPGHDNWVLVSDIRTEQEASHTHVVFELSRPDCRFEGGATEHAFSSDHPALQDTCTRVIPVIMAWTDPKRLHMACDYAGLATDLLKYKKHLPS